MISALYRYIPTYYLLFSWYECCLLNEFIKLQFIIYGVGIDRVSETLQLLHDLELGRKYGKTYTYDGIKYDLEEFKQNILEDVDFFNSLKSKIIDTLTGIEEVEEVEPVVIVENDERMNVIGQNGNDGTHYEAAKDIDVVTPQVLSADLFDANDL